MLSDKDVKGFKEQKGKDFKVLTHDEYHNKVARQCGRGIDSCDSTVHLIDQATDEHFVLYVSNGQLVTESYEEYLATGADEPTPPCTYITSIEDNATGVAVDAAITWSASTGATGYKITIGTASGGHQVCNLLDRGTALTAIPGTTVGIAALAENTEYFVTITPYNADGNTTGCTEISFTTITGN